MTFLPIVQRELRVAARRKGTYYIRFATGLGAALVGGMAALLMLAGARLGSGMMSGAFVFYVLSYYLFGICLLAGIFLAADSLSEERREGTLGLLFLTDLKGYDVVLGKLLAVSLNAFYGLLAVFPVLGLSLVIGGVEGAEFGRMCLALANALWFSTTLALWVSSRAESGLGAMTRAALLLIALAILLPAMEDSMDSTWAFWAAAISPTEPFLYAQAGNFWHQGEKFWGSLAASHLAGWVFLALASWRLSRFVEGAPVSRRANARQSSLADGGLLGKRQRRTALLEINPVLWLMEDSPRLRWINWLLCGLGCFLMSACVPSGMTGVSELTYCAWPFYFMLELLFAVQACRFFSEARRTGMLDLLRATPLSNKTIIDGQWMALRRLFLWPVLILMWVELLCVGVSALATASGTSAAKFPNAVVSMLDLIFVDLAVPWQVLKAAAGFLAIGWFGMWLALTGKKPQAAAGLTILFVIVLPGVALCVPTCVVDLIFILVCRSKLGRDFRLVRAEAVGKSG